MIKGILLAFAIAFCAQPAPAQTPNPDQLSTDWWLHFTVGEATTAADVAGRVAEFKDSLNRQLSATEPAQQAALRPHAERLIAALERYAALLQAEPPPPESVPADQKSYTVDEALARHAEFRQTETDARTLRGEVEWQRSLLEQSFEQQKERKTDYLALDPNDSERLERGLRLMGLRAELEARSLELTAQSKTAGELEDRLAAFERELERIPKMLTATSADVDEWERRVAEAESALEETRKLETPPAAALASDPVENAATARREALASLNDDLALNTAELSVQRARLGLLAAKIAMPGAKPDWDAMNDEIERFEELQTSARNLAARASDASNRIRAAAGAQLANADPAGPLATILNETLTLTDATDAAAISFDRIDAEAEFLASLLSQRELALTGRTGRATEQSDNWFQSSWRSLTGVLNHTLFEINEQPVTLMGIIWAALILIVAWWGSKAVRRAIQRFGDRQERINKSSVYTLQRVIHYLILTIGFFIALSTLGLDLTKITLFASALGVGLGFGLQNLVSNFVSGLIILFEKSLNVGDFVELQSGITGEVREINMRSTLVTTNDNVDILVPNSEFINGHVTNWTLREALRRIRIPFGVAYGSDKDLVKQAALEAASRVPWTYDGSGTKREPRVWLVNFGDSSLDFELVVWLTPDAVKRPAAVQADYYWEIESSLKQHGIEIPFPQRDLHLRSGFQNTPAKPDQS